MTSTYAPINASVVQGSGFGPTAYDVGASDLQTVDPANRIAKYADETHLITGAPKRDTIEMELNHVANWAAKNNLRLNTSKSSEMVILRKGKTAPPPIPGIKRVSNMDILGVTISRPRR